MTYKIERVLTKERLEQLWPQLHPLFDKCIKKALHGEFVSFDIKQLALDNKAHIFIFADESDVVHMALALEFINFPRLRAANLRALGGKNLVGFSEQFFAGLKWWLKLSGVQVLDAMVSNSMRRLLTNKLGFERVYHHMRLGLGD